MFLGYENSPKFPVVHLHYLQHFGASADIPKNKILKSAHHSPKNWGLHITKSSRV